MSAEIKAVISEWIDQKMTTASSPRRGPRFQNVIPMSEESDYKRHLEEEEVKKEQVRRHGHRMLDEPGDWEVTKAPRKESDEDQ